MATRTRWQTAQSYERSYWAQLANRIASGTESQLTWYSWKAKQMESHLDGFISHIQRDKGRILEVGSGPIGIVSFMEWGNRYAIDPLDDFYRADKTLSELRRNDVSYYAGSGEEMPFESEQFELVILDNVLDHVLEASQVLAEIRRVLVKDGKFYVAVNVHTVWGAFLHKILSRLKIDRGHPYTFTPRSLKSFLETHGFEIQKDYITDYRQAKSADIRSAALKNKVKGFTGLSEFVYYGVCSKKGMPNPILSTV